VVFKIFHATVTHRWYLCNYVQGH